MEIPKERSGRESEGEDHQVVVGGCHIGLEGWLLLRFPDVNSHVLQYYRAHHL